MSEHRDRVAYDMIRDGAATVSEVADLLGTSRQRVAHWCRAGFNPGRRAYKSNTRTHGKPVECVDARASRKSWLAAEFEARLSATPIEERLTIKSARRLVDLIMRGDD